MWINEIIMEPAFLSKTCNHNQKILTGRNIELLIPPNPFELSSISIYQKS